ncbi:RNA polymerase sigma factor [Dyadobacter aurulentus]|uniref:RNA polymerase sigma factor n=1 Tax=Dyadobacter sp. UC 10 TaxID=2605428 RepID=UPI0011F22872|nr:sigma-70 family RNA polymerase sigma factor [Dyadobacter sp. UC 10]KAA0990307.1 sigma-70 family RNA polymerase sigma factor [Dyadobacter sp. UC 10]
MPDNFGDEKLIEALQEGSDEAFTVIYHRYWYNMFLVAYRKLRSKEVAEEIVQDIFMRLWREKASQKILNMDYYLFSAVRYEVIDHIRRNISEEALFDQTPDFSTLGECDVENQIALSELITAIDEGLHLLPEKSQEIFRLYRFEHWPLTRIAKHFNLTEKAVEYHITKATKSVRSYLKQALSVLLACLPPFLS